MKPTVLTHDSLDNRRQAFTAILRGLSPARRLDFLDWCIAFARATTRNKMLINAKADRAKMQPIIEAASRRDDTADLLLANEIYCDINTLAHQFGAEWLPMVLELEVWASDREATPVPVAASAWLSRRLGMQPAVAIHSPGRCDSFLSRQSC